MYGRKTMTTNGLFLVFLASILTVISNLSIRAGIERAGGFAPSMASLFMDMLYLLKQPLLIMGFTLYAGAALVWFRVISTENLNSAYPVLTGMTFIMLIIGATLIFTEPFSWLKAFGVIIILLGITVISLS